MGTHPLADVRAAGMAVQIWSVLVNQCVGQTCRLQCKYGPALSWVRGGLGRWIDMDKQRERERDLARV